MWREGHTWEKEPPTHNQATKRALWRKAGTAAASPQRSPQSRNSRAAGGKGAVRAREPGETARGGQERAKGGPRRAAPRARGASPPQPPGGAAGAGRAGPLSVPSLRERKSGGPGRGPAELGCAGPALETGGGSRERLAD
ncbi:unnamed protein product [Rangifer tarandus platyrhynchus]|uniref:Uncharacterized protein n=2 Tax=Rangifer tarandus platyrhynchus TaxID=3082113 RepID=A0ACB0E7M2_RANTA|nr:unnamed protein product [Rangifer tarandus platyrhynchus]CAI9696638.1 unnamed protein product [Rangifer tarandus platyrhynchus]